MRLKITDIFYGQHNKLGEIAEFPDVKGERQFCNRLDRTVQF